jgi:hypothetical protein
VDFLVTLRRLKELKVDVFFYNERIHLLGQAGELLLTLHAGIAQAESENKSENILTNEKYTGASLYGEIESAEFPSTKRMVSNPLEVHRSRNHHPPIIHERRFKRVQKLKAKRSNIEVDEYGNKVRKSTHYSSKKIVNRAKKTTKPQD